MAGLRSAALIERERELTLIDQALDAVRGGQSRLVVIEGEAGLGKTRLLLAVRERARAAELCELAAHASPLERSYAFGAVRQLFEPELRQLTENERERLLRGQARAAAGVLGLAPAARRGSEDPLYGVLNGLYWLCVGLAERCPLAITIDDAHWLDEPSLRFLAFTATRLEDIPVLIALTTRPFEPGTEAPALIAELENLVVAETIRLCALSSDAVWKLVAFAYGRPPTPEFASACHAATGGNPLLLHELLIEAQAAGVAPSGEGARLVSALGPARVSGSVLARVARIGHEAAELTRALAVLGDGATVARATALSGLCELEAMHAHGRLADAGILAEGPPLRLAHPLVRQAIYEHLPYPQRMAAHTKAAQILAATGASAEQVASHLLITHPRADAQVVAVLRQAAAQASERGSAQCAASYLSRALQEPPPPEVRGRVLAELGIAEHNANDPAAASHLKEALELAGDEHERARIGLVAARAIWHTGKIADAVALLHRVADHLDPRLAAPLEAELIAIARLDPRTRQTGLRRIHRHDPDQIEDQPARRLLLANLAFEHAVAASQPAAGVVRLAQRALAGGRLLDQEGSESTVYYLAVWALAQADAFPAAEAHMQAGLQLAREEGSLVGYARALTFRADLCYRRGLLTEAHADIEHALEHLTPIRAPLAVAFLIDLLLEADDLHAADEALARFGLVGQLPDSILHTIVLERRARLRLAQHRTADALSDIQLCQRRASRWGASSPAFLAWRSTSALIHHQAGRSAQARALAAEEVTHAKRFAAPRALGITLRVSGLIANREQGLTLLRESLLALQGSGAEFEHARTLIDLGAALRRAGQRAAGREKLRAGLELADRHAALALAARARSELRAAGGRPVRAPRSGLSSLSAAELRVARMAAGGLSNREIAQALFVTPKTVEWHLGQTYRKLGLTSRAQLAAALDTHRPEQQRLAPAG